MKAILVFRDWKNIDFESSITQKSREGTHILLNGANDFCGRGSYDQCDLLAPCDCVVKAISRTDNTIFFESKEAVETPIGKYKVWFMCTHMNDKEFNNFGMKVGKEFAQGTPCFTEGTKGIGAGNHIHMEQGIGEFGGGSSPYYKSNEYFWYNGKKYAQYYPVVKDGGYECPINDIFYLKRDVDYSDTNIKECYSWKYSDETKPIEDDKDKEIARLKEKLRKIQEEAKYEWCNSNNNI